MLDLADRWILVVDTRDATPLFEIQRGSLFVFENESLQRAGWDEFKKKPLADKLAWLADGIGVLRVEDEDMFLVRVADANTVLS